MTEHKRYLEARYGEHHAKNDRYGFALAATERGEQFAAWVGSGKRVLDIGCRDGALTRHLVHGNEVVGVDIDRDALALARANLGIETAWVDVDAEPLPYEASSFDVVVAGEVLEHLQFPEHAVEEVHRVLQPGGQFIGSTSNEYHWRNRLAFLLGREFTDATHLQLFSLAALRDLLARRFERVTILPLGGIGGRRVGTLPVRLSRPLVARFPQLLAHDWLFRASKSE